MFDITDHNGFGGGDPNDRRHQHLEEAISNAMTNYHFVGSLYGPCTYCYPMSVMVNIFMDHFKDKQKEEVAELLEKFNQFIVEKHALHNLTKGKKN